MNTLDDDMLLAALGPSDAALAAWTRARARVDLAADAPRSEHHRLLPLVHHNLLNVTIDERDRASLADRYERTRRDNEARAAIAAEWVRRFREAGIDACLLKGIPLAQHAYGDLGLRPMRDIDLLVPIDRADDALDLALAHGWRDGGGCDRDTLWRLYHGSGMFHPDHGQLDVHWQLSGLLVDRDAPRASASSFWARAQPASVGGAACLQLEATDLLLHVTLHGIWRGSNARLRWVADGVTLLRAMARDGTSVDAGRILDVADRFRLGPLLHEGLSQLAGPFSAPLPPDLLPRLAERDPGWRARRAGRVLTSAEATERLAGLGHLRAYWQYSRWGWSDGHAARTLPAFLVELWGLDHPRQIPWALVTRTGRRHRSR